MAMIQGATGTGLGAAEGQPSWMTNIFTPIWETTSSILKAQWGQPAPGTVITTPQGQYIRQANGLPVPVATIGANVGVGGSGSSGMLLGIGAIILLGLVMTGLQRR